jgi:hypothetical protein
MRTSTAFFAGVGTVFVAIAAGLGGGLTIGNVMSSQTPQYGKLDRHAASSDSRATKDPMVPVPYLAATKESANAAIVVSPAERKPAQPQQNEAANSSAPPAPAAPLANVTASNEQTAKPSDAASPDVSKADVSKADVAKADISKPSEVVAAKPSAAVQPVVAREQVSAPDDAYAKARDADLKRDADQKRAERRKAERRAQQWADRRRAQQSRDQDDLRNVEESVREDSEARAYPVYREQPARAEFPIRLFGND